MSNKGLRNPTNFPALGYLTRVTTAWNELLLEQTADAQSLWDDVKAGQFKWENVAKLMANGMEGYYDVLVEATRSEDDANRTVWVHIPFSHKQAGTAEFAAVLSRQQPERSEIHGSPFRHVTERHVLPDDVYATLRLISCRKLLIQLDTRKLADAKLGQYMSVVTASNRGPGQPLVIVLLDVSE